jgi:hypothetical protein
VELPCCAEPLPALGLLGPVDCELVLVVESELPQAARKLAAIIAATSAAMIRVPTLVTARHCI